MCLSIGWLAATDEQTLLVLISHVLFRSSFIQDLAAITRPAHEVGALLPTSISRRERCHWTFARSTVDFATGGSVKWLCGGTGARYLYVRRDLWLALGPRFTGWVAHAQPFSFETKPIDYALDSFRFLNGTRAIPALHAARSGYDIVAEIGVDKIREKSLRQTAKLIELALQAGFPVNSPRCCRAGAAARS